MIQRMFERMLEKRNEGGFTLIELLIVIIILAILAAIVVFAVGSTGANSKYAACNSDAKTFETALESYKAQVGTYPPANLVVSSGNQTATYPAGSLASAGSTGAWTYSVSSGGATTIYGAGSGSTFPQYGSQLTQSTVAGGSTAGPYMRALASTSHYELVTDGSGNVYVLPPGFTLPSVTALTASPSVSGQGIAQGDSTSLNFDQAAGAVCSDANVVK
ncbi:MAG TPA: prepilin-type N-terminal cleavage/methylation domain-containing protein [Acidimicrobiales bacterium]|nr:prepilin-type N-terminal cleavage/methylation domain-containing protein [Acidimicrobiales bacterium]